jgi:hypothetical protein
MKTLWWTSAIIAAVIGIVSHVTVMAIAQTVNAPYPSLLPSTNADKAAPPAMLGTSSVTASPTVQASTVNTGGLAKGGAAGASKRDFKPIGRTTAQALVAPSTIIAVGILGGLVVLATAGVGGSSNASGASSTN